MRVAQHWINTVDLFTFSAGGEPDLLLAATQKHSAERQSHPRLLVPHPHTVPSGMSFPMLSCAHGCANAFNFVQGGSCGCEGF